MPFSHAIPFSAHQLQTLASWSESRPCGLEVKIATDQEELDEVVQLFRHGQSRPAYFITAISTGEVDVIGEDGETDVAPGLGWALAWVEQQEAFKPVPG